MQRPIALPITFVLLLLAACSDEEVGEPDAGSADATRTADASERPEAGSLDTGSPRDGGSGDGASIDAGEVVPDRGASNTLSIALDSPPFLAMRRDGVLVVAGTLASARDLGTGLLTPPEGKEALVVVRLGSDLSVLGASLVPGFVANRLYPSSITAVGSSAFAVAGFLGNSNVYGDGSPFVVVLDAAGEIVWSLIPSASQSLELKSVSGGLDDSVFVQGALTGTTSLGGQPLGTVGRRSVVSAAFGVGGAHTWSVDQLPPSGRSIVPTGIQGGPGGSAYTAILTGPVVDQRLVADGFLSRVDGAGAPSWTLSLIGDGYQSVGSISAAGDLIAAAGGFDAPVDFGSQTLRPSEGSDAWVGLFGSDRSLLWLRSLGGADHQGCSVSLGEDSSVLLLCRASQELRLGDQVYTGATDAIILKLDPEGHPLWGRAVIGVSGGGAYASSGALGSDGAVFVGLVLPEDTDLGLGVIPAGSTVVAKFAP